MGPRSTWTRGFASLLARLKSKAERPSPESIGFSIFLTLMTRWKSQAEREGQYPLQHETEARHSQKISRTSSGQFTEVSPGSAMALPQVGGQSEGLFSWFSPALTRQS